LASLKLKNRLTGRKEKGDSGAEFRLGYRPPKKPPQTREKWNRTPFEDQITAGEKWEGGNEKKNLRVPHGIKNRRKRRGNV